MQRVCVPFLLASASAVHIDSPPVVQIKMDPPPNMFPTVSAQIKKLNLERERAEEGMVSELQRIYDSNLQEAKHLIQDAARKTKQSGLTNQVSEGASFLRNKISSVASYLSSNAFSMKLNVFPVPPPSGDVLETIQKMEQTRARSEASMFSQAGEELRALTAMAINSLHHSVPGYSAPASPGFLKVQERQHSDRSALPDQASVRLLPSSEAFSKVGELVEEMVLKRDRAESKERALILDMEIRFVKELKSMMGNELRHPAR